VAGSDKIPTLCSRPSEGTHRAEQVPGLECREWPREPSALAVSWRPG